MTPLAALIARASVLATEVIVGYENEQQEKWPENAKVHLCQVCYGSAKKLREALKDFTNATKEGRPI